MERLSGNRTDMYRSSFLTALSAIILLLATSCNKNNEHPVPATAKATITLLKVDYLTRQFEGGRQFFFTPSGALADSVPLTIYYKGPGDFGNITLKYAPTADTVFDGTIIWMGRGEIRYPAFAPASAFGTSGIQIPPPDSATLQGLYPDVHATRFTNSTIRQAWAGIAGLYVARDNHVSGGRKALLLYMPSVGIGNPADWDFIWVLYQKTEY